MPGLGFGVDSKDVYEVIKYLGQDFTLPCYSAVSLTLVVFSRLVSPNSNVTLSDVSLPL